MKKIIGMKKLLVILMAILIPLGTLQVTEAASYHLISCIWEFVDFEHDEDLVDEDINYCKCVRIRPNENAYIQLCHVGMVNYVKYTKVESSSEKLSVSYSKEKKEIGQDVCVKASEEGTYTIKFTAKIKYLGDGGKYHTYTHTGETTVYVYDFPHNLSDKVSDQDGYPYSAHTIDELFYDTKFYMNGKRLKPAKYKITPALRSGIPKGRLTAKLDKSWKGITITKIKVYGTADKGGKRTTIKNAKKGKKVYLNTQSRDWYDSSMIRTEVRIYYKDKYTGVTLVKRFRIKYKVK